MYAKRMFVCVLAIVAILAVSQVQATAIVTWETPVNIVNDPTQVSTEGTTERAYFFGPGVDTAINTVVFKPFDVGSHANTSKTVDNTTLSAITANTQLNFDDRSYVTANPYNSMDANYKKLSSYMAYAYGDWGSGGTPWSISGAISLTLDNLTSGQQYLFQFWLSDPGSSGTDYRRGESLTNDGVSTSQPLYANSSTAEGGLGQYVIGRFTANSTTETFTFNPQYSINASASGFQLRAIPEPGTLNLAVIGLLGLLCYAWRKRR